jgi:hypothetical protein
MADVAMLESNLVHHLKQVPDYRAKRGQRYPLWLMLLVTILGVMSGAQGYQALEEFGIRHYGTLAQALALTTARLPSDSTLRTLFRQVDFTQLTQQFQMWASAQFTPLPQEWFAVDGKSLRGTLQGTTNSMQNFVAVVSLYSHQRRIVVAQQGYENKKQSEITVVYQLLEQLGMAGVVVSLDALHAQKNSEVVSEPRQRLSRDSQRQPAEIEAAIL